ncbi:MAG: hypothetical protein DMD30_05265 [Gemmatimonadetes bacterium]|nr:MAG: hypothetical protein DMD30_05265 [Gemmatimonadota bacterium]
MLKTSFVAVGHTPGDQSSGRPIPIFDTRAFKSSRRAPLRKLKSVYSPVTRKQSRVPYPAPTRAACIGASARFV